jgi:hypothetical protein
MEIKLDRKNSEQKKNGEGDPGTRSAFLYYKKKNPGTQKDEEENPSLRKKRGVEMPKINTKGVDDKNRYERKVEGSTHVRLKRMNLLGCRKTLASLPSPAHGGIREPCPAQSHF